MLVFIYSTLKRKEQNHRYLAERGAKFISKGITVQRWPLVISNLDVPFLLNNNSYGKVIFQIVSDIRFIKNSLFYSSTRESMVKFMMSTRKP